MAGSSGYAGLLALTEPDAVLRSFLEARVRPDGRRLDEFREVALEVGTVTPKSGPFVLTAGSALARVGSTEAACSIGLSLAQAGDPAASFSVFVGTSGRDAAWARSLEALLTDAYAQQPRAGRWLVSVAVTCLYDDGGLVDCCALAVAAALGDSRLPEATDADDIVEVGQASELLPCVFALPCTYAVVDCGGEKVVMVDPTAAEERSSTLVTVLVAPDRETVLKLRQQPGGAAKTTRAVLRACVRGAFGRAATLATELAASCSSERAAELAGQ